MATLLLVIHVMIALALIVTVLLQRSEGGGLGIGGSGNMMSGRSSANLMTRTTAILAAAFFVTSIALTIIARTSNNQDSKLDAIKVDAPKDPGSVLDGLPPAKTPEPKAPDAPVVPQPE